MKISIIKDRKKFIETRDENIGIEPISSILRSSLRDLIRLQIEPQNDKLLFPFFRIFRYLKRKQKDKLHFNFL